MEKTTINFGTFQLSIDQEVNTHSFCECCDEPVLNVLLRVVNKKAMCIDCLQKDLKSLLECEANSESFGISIGVNNQMFWLFLDEDAIISMKIKERIANTLAMAIKNHPTMDTEYVVIKNGYIVIEINRERFNIIY